ncbi:MAG: restriction endonuclease subunit S, partial [Saprospiraceae bacterium]
PDGIPFIRAGNLQDRISIDGADTLPIEILNTIGSKASKAGDAVFTSKGSVGRMSFVNEDDPIVIYSPQLCYWRSLDQEKIHSKWLFYWMHGREFWGQIYGLKGQTDMADYVSLRDQRQMEITLPSIKSQRKVAKTISSLDDKIALNRRQNETLEAMAQALFKSWFVDFDPVIDNALAAGVALPEALQARAARRQAVLESGTYPRLDAKVQALFPDRFEWSEKLGKFVPEGWESSTLGKFVKQIKNSVSAHDINPETPYIGLQQMPRNSIALSEWKKGEEVESNKYRFKKDDILFGKLRPYFHKVGVAPIEGVCSTDIIVLKATKPEYDGIAIALMSSKDVVDYATSSSTGTRMPRASWNYLKQYSQVGIPDNLCRIYSDRIKPSISKIHENIHESTTLSSLRDLLLRELIG